MGKSLKNSVSPDEIYASYSADTLRLYEMAMGPLDGDRPAYERAQSLWSRASNRPPEGLLHLWEALADRYKDRPEVAGYNPINEPSDRTAAVLPAFYTRLRPTPRPPRTLCARSRRIPPPS